MPTKLNSEPMMDSFKAWRSVEGDFVMPAKFRNPIWIDRDASIRMAV
jgi:hypothetical protein